MKAIQYRICQLLALSVGALAATQASAQTSCQTGNENTAITASTPSAVFGIPSPDNGTIVHLPTGLMWKRCSQGQSWNGSTCTGTAVAINWASALDQADTDVHAGFSDWRLPNAKELNSLIETRCHTPAINVSIFPNTASALYWSSTPVAETGTNAWVVSFFQAGIVQAVKSGTQRVRLVRGGQ